MAVHHEFDRTRFIPPSSTTPAGYGAFLVGRLGEPDGVVLVAEEGGAVVGYAYGALEGPDWMELRGPAGVIYDLAVNSGSRGRGVGRALLEAAADRLLALGAPQLVLAAASANHAAQRLFAAAGFRPTMVEMTRDGA